MTAAAPPGAATVRATVHHRRTRPFTYEFTHRTTMWLVDAADPNSAFPRWLSPLARIRSEDHFAADDTRPLPAKVRSFLDAQGLDWSADRVLLLVNARSLGYVFDPLTTFFCFDAEGRLEGVLAEVHNTYGERHCYPLPVDGDARRNAAAVDKAFYVSPFFAVEGRYDIRTRITADDVAVAISLTTPDGSRVFQGSVHGDLVPATRSRTLRAVARNPLPSQRVSALIRWHGIRLWLRKLPVVPRRPHQAPKGMA
ncbi:MAG TPA: DUF1365 domain-containing protein [Nocardioidaceae bacterium]|nr:DUF1365 domain-containing protein [Nocardioidaceae bacterium]